MTKINCSKCNDLIMETKNDNEISTDFLCNKCIEIEIPNDENKEVPPWSSLQNPQDYY